MCINKEMRSAALNPCTVVIQWLVKPGFNESRPLVFIANLEWFRNLEVLKLSMLRGSDFQNHFAMTITTRKPRL